MKVLQQIRSLFVFILACATAVALHGQRELVVNGDFEDSDLYPWEAREFGDDRDDVLRLANLVGLRDTTNPISGRASALLIVSGSDDPALSEWWLLNFRQMLDLQEGAHYTLRFKIRASQPATIRVNLFETDQPFRAAISRTFEVGTDVETYEFAGTSPFTGSAQIFFAFGKTERNTEFWLDEVSIVERVD